MAGWYEINLKIYIRLSLRINQNLHLIQLHSFTLNRTGFQQPHDAQLQCCSPGGVPINFNYLLNVIFSIGDSKQFYPNFKQWIDFSTKSNGPKIFIGMPSHDRAAFGRGYWRTPSEVAAIYQVWSRGIIMHLRSLI